eukprot:5950923-Amphidinium_carterae.2
MWDVHTVHHHECNQRFAQFFAVCAIMYFGVEPNLQKMPASQRRDVRVRQWCLFEHECLQLCKARTGYCEGL